MCYSEDLPEVDLVSLLEEQIPRYVLRADTLTDFAGYDNQDWIRTPVLPPEADLPLSPELIDETLKYFGEYLLFCLEMYSLSGGEKILGKFVDFDLEAEKNVLPEMAPPSRGNFHNVPVWWLFGCKEQLSLQ